MASLGRIVGQPMGTTVLGFWGVAAPFQFGAALMAIAFLGALTWVKAARLAAAPDAQPAARGTV
jgi:hypothetical protein